MNASEGIQFIEDMQRQEIKPEAARRIVSLVESQQGGLATKADLEQAERRLEDGQKRLEDGQKRLERRLDGQLSLAKWVAGSALVIAGIFATAFFYQISDIRADIRLLLQSQQTPERAGQDRGN